MPSEEQLAIAVVGKIDDFARAMRTVEGRVAGVEKKISAEMRKVDQSTRRAAQAMEKNFSEATVGIGGKLRSLRSLGVDAKSMFGAATGAVGALGSGTGLIGVVGGFAGGAAVAQINQTATAIADLSAEAERAGLSFQQFQELKFSFERERVSVDALTDGFKELSLRADEFIVTGAGPAAEAFQRLGFGADDLKQRLSDPMALFLEITRRLEGMDRAAQIRIADEIFGGTGGEQFVQLLDKGAASLQRNVEEAHRFGAVLSDDVAAKAVELTRHFDNIQAMLAGRIQPVVIEIGYHIAKWAEGALRFVTELGKAELPAGLRREFNELIKGAPDIFANDFSQLPKGTRIVDPDLAREMGVAVGHVVTEVGNLATEHERLDAEWTQILDRMAAAQRLGDDMAVTALERQLESVNEELRLVAERMAQIKAIASSTTLQFIPGLGNIPVGSGAAAASSFVPGVGGAPGAIRSAAGPLRTTGAHVNTQGLNADFERSLRAFSEAARQAGHDIQVGSGYRSPERQAELYAAAVRRYGSEAAARRWVAPPGRSNHNYGLAADLAANGQTLGRPGTGEATAWAHANAANYGLHFPLGNEAWHVEPQGPNGTRVYGARGNVGVALPQAADRTGITEQRAEEARQAAEEARRLADEQIAQRERQAEVVSSFNERIQEEIDLEKIRQEMLKAGTYTSEQINAALSQESEARAAINERKQAGIAVDAEMEAAIRREIAAKFELTAANDKLEVSNQKLAERQEELKQAFIGVGQPVVDTFMSIIDGSAKAEDAIKGLIKQLANMVLQAALFGQGPLGGLFGGGLVGALFPKLPGRAVGGPVTSGQPYIVGEHGREVMVPNSNGRIMSMSQVGAARGGGGSRGAGTVVVRIDGANGDDHVRTLVRQGVTAGLRDYDRTMQGSDLLGRFEEAQFRYG